MHVSDRDNYLCALLFNNGDHHTHTNTRTFSHTMPMRTLYRRDETLKMQSECQKVIETCPGIVEQDCITNVTHLRQLNLHALIAMSVIAFLALVGSILLYL